jgi:hypothetical protein
MQVREFHECYNASGRFKAKWKMMALDVLQIKPKDTVLVEANISRYRIKAEKPIKWWQEWKAFLELKSISLIHEHTSGLVDDMPSPSHNDEIFI